MQCTSPSTEASVSVSQSTWNAFQRVFVNALHNPSTEQLTQFQTFIVPTDEMDRSHREMRHKGMSIVCDWPTGKGLRRMTYARYQHRQVYVAPIAAQNAVINKMSAADWRLDNLECDTERCLLAFKANHENAQVPWKPIKKSELTVLPMTLSRYQTLEVFHPGDGHECVTQFCAKGYYPVSQKWAETQAKNVYEALMQPRSRSTRCVRPIDATTAEICELESEQQRRLGIGFAAAATIFATTIFGAVFNRRL